VNGNTGTIESRARITEDRPLTAAARYVLQVSRWDSLRDPIGVVEGFAGHVVPRSDAHLIYAGPDVAAVADDPEGALVYQETRDHWEALPAEEREASA
jgi:trehalose synthase